MATLQLTPDAKHLHGIHNVGKAAGVRSRLAENVESHWPRPPVPISVSAHPVTEMVTSFVSSSSFFSFYFNFFVIPSFFLHSKSRGVHSLPLLDGGICLHAGADVVDFHWTLRGIVESGKCFFFKKNF